ncbi:hypothetical protein C0Q70_19723 [Pomacea canaliculata]|uniref:Protein xylosyltransferase n=1 Tax=Pomacea canaliculata TaxID=400727 RepID=A0A2T7NDJ5_POMCA|nr:hypothetical protein C0Q70_19723 [Pomacea canaliculata]
MFRALTTRHPQTTTSGFHRLNKRQATQRTEVREMENMAMYCVCGGKTSNLNQEVFSTVSQEETGFPLAFSLLVYRDVDQVVRLLRAIYRPHNLYCVHVDRKSNEALQASLRMVIACLPNVLLVPRAINVTWGSVTTLEPELECMRLLWKQRVKWRYFINLTGQEFPLKTNKELVHILKTFRGANDIRGTHNP